MTEQMRPGKVSRRLRVVIATVGLALSLLLPDAYAQTPSLTLALPNDSLRPVQIRSIRQKQLVLASVVDIAQTLRLTVKENAEEYSVEVRRHPAVVTFIADNSFVPFVEQGKERNARQLCSSVMTSAGIVYAPVTSLVESFEMLFGAPATYDASSNTIHVGKGKPAFDISSFIVEGKSNGTIVRIPSIKKFSDTEVILREDGWLYLTILGAKGDASSLRQIKPSGGVRKLVVNQFAASLQLAFQLDGKFTAAEIVREEGSSDIVLFLRSPGEPAKSVAEEAAKRGAAADLDEQRRRYELDVIVLDAGHGGKDPGTIGLKGTYEKNVVLPIVLKLGKLINKYLKGVKVVYTRESDRFVELDRRGQIANEHNGKLFISVHANAMPRKPHPRRGFEVYLLRPGRTDEAITIAERENSVIELEEGYEQRYKKLTDDNFILVTMAQAAHMKSSERFAEHVAREMGRTLDTENNGVAQAGFYVLVGASMPNVLIETAYLSNWEDERLLRREDGQQKYAAAIFAAIKKYKTEYEQLLKEGDDLGERSRR